MRARLPAPVHFFPSVSLARAHTMRLPIRVSTQTHTLVQALRVPKTSARLFTIRPKPTYYRLVVDGDQRLPERPADVCQRLSSPSSGDPPRAVRRTHRQVSASHPLHRKVEARFGIARSRADRKRRAPRDSNHDMRHYTTPTPRQSMHRPQMRHVHRSSRHGCNARCATLHLANATSIESPATQSATAGRSEARADA